MAEEEVVAEVDGFISWPEIVGLHVVRKNLIKDKEKAKETGGIDYTPQGVLDYKGKIKLHGCNGGINIYEREGEYIVEAQSRSRVLSAKDDLEGFAKWTISHNDSFVHVRKALKDAFPNTSKTVVFGEWCGEGIQRNVALCKIKRKIFAVFSLMVDDAIVAEPDIIRSFFPSALPENLYIIPWMTSAECGEMIGLNYNEIDHLEAEVVKINSLIGRIDNTDPWVLETFNVEGPGEGVVWYPVGLQTGTIPYLARRDFSKLAFKAKGEKHAVVKQAKPVQIKPQVSAGVIEFAAMFVTDGRGEQGISKIKETGETPTKAHVPKFMQWMLADVKKECSTELEASGLTWPQVEKEVTNAAKKWFLAHVN